MTWSSWTQTPHYQWLHPQLHHGVSIVSMYVCSYDVVGTVVGLDVGCAASGITVSADVGIASPSVPWSVDTEVLLRKRTRGFCTMTSGRRYTLSNFSYIRTLWSPARYLQSKSTSSFVWASSSLLCWCVHQWSCPSLVHQVAHTQVPHPQSPCLTDLYHLFSSFVFFTFTAPLNSHSWVIPQLQ